MIRIIIADDHTLFRSGLRRLLDSFDEVDVVAEAGNALEVLSATDKVDADLLICDLTMPGAQGTQLISTVHLKHPKLPVLVLSMHDEPATIRRALLAGATGYLTKEASPELLYEAVNKVAKRQQYLPSDLAEALAFASVAPSTSPHDSLSGREREVYKLIARGTPLAKIANLLHLSPKTITTHKTHLMEKLGVENTADLIRYALEHKLFG